MTNTGHVIFGSEIPELTINLHSISNRLYAEKRIRAAKEEPD